MTPPTVSKDMPVDPLAVLREAIINVRAVRYAFGILGVAAAASLARAFFSSTRTAVYATLAMLGLMILLWLFAQLARLPERWLKYPAMVVAWSLFSIVALVPIFLFCSVFFNKPKPFGELRNLFEAKVATTLAKSPTPVSEANNNEATKFAGTITDSTTSKPLGEVKVRMTPDGPVMAKTDSEGIYGFSLPTAPPDRIALIFEAAGHQTRTESVYPSQNLDFSLSPVH